MRLFLIASWLPQDIEREIFVVPEMGPVSSGYNLEGLPNSWEEACRLRPILQSLWQTACNRCR